MSNTLPVIGITCGDVNGVGPEIIIKALSNKAFLELCTPVVFCAGKVISYYKKNLTGFDFTYVPVRNKKIQPGKLNLVPCWEEDIRLAPGTINTIGATYALKSLETAASFLKEGLLEALVTAPVAKSNLKEIGFGFPGQTEYFGHHFNGEPLMMMVWDQLRVVPFTGHVPLACVPEMVTTESLIQKIRKLAQSLRQDFQLTRPHIAVLGLNPHAGDKGAIGREEQEKIIPALAALEADHQLLAAGPFSPDGFWASGMWRQFDAVLALYHDQGLIPFKMLAGREGVNFTAGLSVIRTSPDHGPAFDIAGKSIADEQSLRAAIYLAIDILRNRKFFEQATHNPLTKQEKEMAKSES
jgi:4-hydroxythreonine-4-phosphate dehydrogenase